MALSEEDKKEILELLRQENQQKQKSVLSSKENLKRWLSGVASHLAGKLVEAAFDLLVDYLLGGLGRLL